MPPRHAGALPQGCVVNPILSPELPAASEPLRAVITAAWLRDEDEHVRALLAELPFDAETRERVQRTAIDLVERVRKRAQDQGAIEAFMREYDLSSEEGCC